MKKQYRVVLRETLFGEGIVEAADAHTAERLAMMGKAEIDWMDETAETTVHKVEEIQDEEVDET
jgi:hypothetical protein